MISLIKYHWWLIRNPQQAVTEQIPNWPVNLGLGVYIISLCTALLVNPKFVKIFSDVLLVTTGLSGNIFVYEFLLLNILYILLIQYYAFPAAVKILSGIPKEEFSVDLCRRIVFYSPISGVIYTVLMLLPLQILYSLLMLDGTMNALGLVIIGIQGVLGIWMIIPAVNSLVIEWKGLKIHFNLSTGKVILSMFIVPLICSLPLIIIYGKAYLSFIKSYL